MSSTTELASATTVSLNEYATSAIAPSFTLDAVRSTSEDCSTETSTIIESPTRVAFFDLPPELRNEVYVLALLDNTNALVQIKLSRLGIRLSASSIALKRASQTWQEPALLQVCKTIRTEASSVYYGSNSFEITLPFVTDSRIATKWLESVIARCGNNPIQHVNFYVRDVCLLSLECFYPIVHLFYEQTLHLSGRPGLEVESRVFFDSVQGPSRSIFYAKYNNLKFQKNIEDAISIGVKAREDGWDEDRVDVEFGRLCLKVRCEPEVERFDRWLHQQRQKRARN